MNKTKIAINLTLAIVVGLGIWFAQHHTPTSTKPGSAPIVTLPDELPAFTMKDTDGVTRSSSEWSGKVLIVNYWATWCPPCLEEMPTLIEIQSKYAPQGVQVVGIAVDKLEQVKEFMELYGVNFPVVVGGDDAIQLGQKMGNHISALPYTAIFDQDGKTLYAQPGKISFQSLEETIKLALQANST